MMSSNWIEFRRKVLANASLRRRLMEGVLERGAFIERMLAVSAECGCVLSRAEIQAAELGGGGREAVALEDELLDCLLDWVPSAVVWNGNEPFVEWFDPGARRFTDSFFGDTVRKCECHPFYRWFRVRSPLSALERLHPRGECVAPAGFIFHLSRCGSTVLSRMLAALERHVVLSEPEPVDAILRAGQRIPELREEQKVLWLQWIVRALGRRRHPDERQLFIKLDCWHTAYLSTIRRAFPNVPWCFLYRHPVEVLASHAKRPGVQMVPAMCRLDFWGADRAVVEQLHPHLYRIRVLTAICEAAVAFHNVEPGLFLNYTQLPGAVNGEFARWFKLEFDAADRVSMQRAIVYHVKDALTVFTPDAAEKQRSGGAFAGQQGWEELVRVYRDMERLSGMQTTTQA